ncbi:MAG: hypothetical protein ACLRNQ_25770 [Flavonifractor plautii]
MTAYQEGVWDSSGELKPDPQTGHYYTKEQYEQVAALKTEGYESLSIAEFNRTLYAALNESEALFEAFERVLMDLPETDPLAPFLVNTVQPSLNEYNARLNEVYSGRAEDPPSPASSPAPRPPTYTATRWRWVGPRQATPSPTGFWIRTG